MALIARRRVRTQDGTTYSAIYHWCQACDQLHGVWVNEQPGDTKASPRWTFNGDMERPTFEPSVRVFTNFDDNDVRLPNNGERTLCQRSQTRARFSSSSAGKAMPFCPARPCIVPRATRMLMPLSAFTPG